MRAYVKAMIDSVRKGSRSDLVLQGCDLAAVPEVVRDLTDLTRADLSGNRLSTVPAWLGDLTGIEVLKLRDNRLTELPETVGGLARLQVLDLSDNRLTGLPAVAVEILREATNYHGDRVAVIRMLAAYPDHETRAVLQEVSTDAHPEVRSEAVRALQDLRS